MPNKSMFSVERGSHGCRHRPCVVKAGKKWNSPIVERFFPRPLLLIGLGEERPTSIARSRLDVKKKDAGDGHCLDSSIYSALERFFHSLFPARFLRPMSAHYSSSYTICLLTLIHRMFLHRFTVTSRLCPVTGDICCHDERAHKRSAHVRRTIVHASQVWQDAYFVSPPLFRRRAPLLPLLCCLQAVIL